MVIDFVHLKTILKEQLWRIHTILMAQGWGHPSGNLTVRCLRFAKAWHKPAHNICKANRTNLPYCSICIKGCLLTSWPISISWDCPYVHYYMRFEKVDSSFQVSKDKLAVIPSSKGWNSILRGVVWGTDTRRIQKRGRPWQFLDFYETPWGRCNSWTKKTSLTLPKIRIPQW